MIATVAAREKDTVEVVSGDRDLLAVATDRVTVLYTGKGIAKMAAMGPAEVQTKYGIPAAHYADFAVLRGDPSDGLPGVPGVGEKTAAALVSRFGTDRGDRGRRTRPARTGSPPVQRRRSSPRGTTCSSPPTRCAAGSTREIPELDDALPAEPADPERLVELSEQLGIEAPLNRLLNAIRSALDSAVIPAPHFWGGPCTV